MLSYYVIYCEKFRKVLQQTEKVALTTCILGYSTHKQFVILKTKYYWSMNVLPNVPHVYHICEIYVMCDGFFIYHTCNSYTCNTGVEHM